MCEGLWLDEIGADKLSKEYSPEFRAEWEERYLRARRILKAFKEVMIVKKVAQEILKNHDKVRSKSPRPSLTPTPTPTPTPSR